MRMGAEGIRINVAGRLGGVEIARSEKFSDGSVPLTLLRADIDYALTEANTQYGVIGIKSLDLQWSIFKNEEINVRAKKVKYRRVHRGNRRGMAMSGNSVSFGTYGLKAIESSWVTARQIEASRIVISRVVRKIGKMWIRYFLTSQ